MNSIGRPRYDVFKRTLELPQAGYELAVTGCFLLSPLAG